MASIATFVNELSQLAIAGVKRNYLCPPNNLNTADLPASFVMPPTNDFEIASTCDGSNYTYAADLIVVMEAPGQGTQGRNFTDLLDLMDNVNTALEGAKFTNMLPHQWATVTQDETPTEVNGLSYWSITATVTARTGA